MADKMTVYGYLRVSSEAQATDLKTSLASQRQTIAAVATLNGWPTPVFFEDAGVSGAVPIERRPNGSRLIALLEPQDILIVSKLDRAFRSALDALRIAEQFQKNRVDLVIADMGSTPVTANGSARMFFGMLALVAEFERDRLRERMTEGKKAKRARGGHVGGKTPYGYRKEGEGTRAILIPDPAEQAVVARARALRSDGCTLAGIAAELAAAGYTNRMGKPFDPTQVRRLTME